MHETITALQVGLTVATTVGVGGTLYAAGNLLGRRGHGAMSSRATYAGRPSANGKGAHDSPEPLPISDGRPLPETISDNPAEHRFEIRLDGELVGFTEYEHREAAVAFHHTEIDPRFRGRGLAGKLIGFALDSSRSAGLSVQPYCPFVRGFAENHREYQDLIVPTTSFGGSAPKSSEV